MTSTVEKGDSFRDTVVSMLEAAGFAAESEVREEFKKADARWWREEIDGRMTQLLETKNYDGTLGKAECAEFAAEYGGLVRSGRAHRAWLISKGPISPDGRALVDNEPGLKAMTFAEFQRRLLGVDRYTQDLVAAYDAERIGEWYVRPHAEDDRDLEMLVREWVETPDALPLAIVAGYGKGKSTFARHLAASLAREALKDQSKRIPVLVPLGDIVDENSLEGLLGKVFASGPSAYGYNFGLFEKLNRAGRFVILFDGFDEMKHGMTLSRFESMIVQLMKLDREAAKLIVLGRDTAFHDDHEFKMVIMGRQRTSGGQEVSVSGRRAFAPVHVREFTLEEARDFVARFFPIAVRDARRGVGARAAEDWIAARVSELLGGQFDDLLVRPVHAQMLCQIATDADVTLVGLSRFSLFDRFVHFLLEREVRKKGRDPRLSLEIRRRFNASLALWLWDHGGASTMTLSTVPESLCRSALGQESFDYDETGLRRELTAGCLVEKGTSGTIYFGHRSLQEFLVAEQLIATFSPSSQAEPAAVLAQLGLVTPEVSEFIVDAAKSDAERKEVVTGWMDLLDGYRRRDFPRNAVRCLVDVIKAFPEIDSAKRSDPWFDWLRYFVANGAVEFEPKSRRAVETLIAICNRAMKSDSDRAGACLILMAEVLSWVSSDRDRLIPQILAAWLDPRGLRDALVVARKLGRTEHHYIRQEDDLPFWAFLQSCSVSGAPPSISVDTGLLRRHAAATVSFGLAETEDMRSEGAVVSTTAQQIYRNWDLREPELDRVRPFFTEPDLRQKILPLEVAFTGRTRETPRAQPKTASARPTLGLKGRRAPE